jgi:hypothetical protein
MSTALCSAVFAAGSIAPPPAARSSTALRVLDRVFMTFLLCPF